VKRGRYEFNGSGKFTTEERSFSGDKTSASG